MGIYMQLFHCDSATHRMVMRRRLVEETVKKGRDSFVGRSTGMLRRPEAMATDRELYIYSFFIFW